MFKDSDTEQAIVDFIYQQPYDYKVYLTLAQQYHYFHQIDDDEGCQVIGRQIAEKILPYA